MADQEGKSIYIYFSDDKILQVGSKLTEEERSVIRREWPAGMKTLCIDMLEESNREPVTRDELRKALQELGRKNEARVTEYRIDAARELSAFFREHRDANRKLIKGMASQLSYTLRLHILNLATIREDEAVTSKPRIKNVEVVNDARVERECDEIRSTALCCSWILYIPS